MHVWNVPHVARWKYRMQKSLKNRHLHTIAQLCRAISLQLRHVLTIGKKHVKQQHLPHMSPQYGEWWYCPLTAEICWRVWGTPANFNRFRILAALLHGTLVVGVSQTLWRWADGATYIWQGGHHVGYCAIHISSLCWWQLLHQMAVFNIMNFTHEKYNELLCSRWLRIVPRIFKLRFHRCYFFWWEGGKCTENLLSIMLKLFSYHRHSILSVNFHHLPVHLWNLC